MIILTQAMVFCTKMMEAILFTKTIHIPVLSLLSSIEMEERMVAKTFYSNGALRSLKVIKNRLHGLQNSWWPDGSKKSQALYNEGLRNGIHYEWYSNGQLEREMRYKKANNMAIKRLERER